jgi:ATP-dependent DNA helicase RecG
VSSSGTLHFGFTPQSLFEPHESRPWNPLIASVFYRRGIIESWGQGTIRMAAWTKEAGLPAPEILEIPGAVVVRFKPSVLGITGATGKTTGKTTGKPIGKTPLAVIGLLAEDPTLTAPQLAARLDKSELTVHRALRTLREAGRLQRVGPDKGGYWQVIE